LAEVTPDIRVRDVHADADSLTVDLMDGRSITVPLAGIPVSFRLRRSSVSGGRSPARVTASIGRKSTKI
jgi:hypothetical protein